MKVGYPEAKRFELLITLWFSPPPETVLHPYDLLLESTLTPEIHFGRRHYGHPRAENGSVFQDPAKPLGKLSTIINFNVFSSS